MTVIVTVSIEGDPERLEEHAAANPGALSAIVDQARGHGLLAHRFYGADDGRILVIDEWPDGDSFHRFFAEAGDDIGKLMGAVGVTSQPQPAIWRELDTDDKVGWE